mmetsp:Transcript_22602/g.37276  ORF Transcript_22602/g.37276 Transcript_22602/m.37276 type:complete len:452 (-) Transcript_22602:326-1681(-)|eukprot:CAMPEP_0184660662 /NCGR_PEP_ID=MMETSP0308-20130426/34660_1 /TAXON_ID=38269 /ORGANISM="Gloeochaete witrockiana, Strain SAG 46.84" /LENGTH=451 /DNA_ID=CAMNT_0027101381 /DNA_START=159 /DNA_END=1514 /DNA_ORIENTATION=+
MSRVRVQVLEARSLLARPLGSSLELLDSFVRLTLTGNSDRYSQTTVLSREQGFNPVWYESFDFEISEGGICSLRAEVMGEMAKSVRSSGAFLLGCCLVDFTTLVNDAQGSGTSDSDKWFTLWSRDMQPAGQLHLRIHVQVDINERSRAFQAPCPSPCPSRLSSPSTSSASSPSTSQSLSRAPSIPQLDFSFSSVQWAQVARADSLPTSTEAFNNESSLNSSSSRKSKVPLLSLQSISAKASADVMPRSDPDPESAVFKLSTLRRMLLPKLDVCPSPKFTPKPPSLPRKKSFRRASEQQYAMCTPRLVKPLSDQSHEASGKAIRTRQEFNRGLLLSQLPPSPIPAASPSPSSPEQPEFTVLSSTRKTHRSQSMQLPASSWAWASKDDSVCVQPDKAELGPSRRRASMDVNESTNSSQEMMPSSSMELYGMMSKLRRLPLSGRVLPRLKNVGG